MYSYPFIVFIAACHVAATACFNTASAAGPKPQTELERIFYDIGVVGYCGLSNPAVSRGFNRQLEQILEHAEVSESHLRDAQNRALTMVEWEWDNRGLGGFRGWCSSEGESAVKRFSN